MNIYSKPFQNIDEYIRRAPRNVQNSLKKIRLAIKQTAPQALEKISYQIPTFYLNGNLVHFAAFKDHISFFPTSSPMAAFKKELSKYKVFKGTIHFPLNKPVPLELIKKIVRYRVKENSAKSNKK